MKRATYGRTSTEEQDVEVQDLQLDTAAKTRGWTRWERYADAGWSGAKSSRPDFDRLKADVRSGKVKEILVPALDRLGRSMIDVVMLLDEWAKVGVVVHSLREGTLDPTTPMGRFTIQILASLSEMERSMIRDRTVQGMAKAAKLGTKSGMAIGRPRRNDAALDRAVAAVSEGMAVRAAARAHNVPLGTLQRRVGPTRKGVTETPA